MRSNSDTQPPVLLDLGDGSWHYNFNIEEVEETVDEVQKTHFEYDTVQFWGPPTYAKVVKAVVRDRYDETLELGIINEYNAYLLGITEDSEAQTKYEDFLSWLFSVKNMVESDLNPVE